MVRLCTVSTFINVQQFMWMWHDETLAALSPGIDAGAHVAIRHLGVLFGRERHAGPSFVGKRKAPPSMKALPLMLAFFFPKGPKYLYGRM